MSADLPFFVSVLQAQSIHGAHDGSQRLDGVAVNDGLVLLYVIARETVLVDDPKHTQTDTHQSIGKVDTHISTQKTGKLLEKVGNKKRAFITWCASVQINQ